MGTGVCVLSWKLRLKSCPRQHHWNFSYSFLKVWDISCLSSFWTHIWRYTSSGKPIPLIHNEAKTIPLHFFNPFLGATAVIFPWLNIQMGSVCTHGRNSKSWIWNKVGLMHPFYCCNKQQAELLKESIKHAIIVFLKEWMFSFH